MAEKSLSEIEQMIAPGNLGQQLLAEITRARKERDAALGMVKDYRALLLNTMAVCLIMGKEEAINDPNRIPVKA